MFGIYYKGQNDVDSKNRRTSFMYGRLFPPQDKENKKGICDFLSQSQLRNSKI